MDALSKYFPTDIQLQNIIIKIAEILKNFFKLFEALKKGLKETFAGYSTATDAQIVWPEFPGSVATGTDATGTDA